MTTAATLLTSVLAVAQAEPEGRTRLDVDFADGLYLTTITDGEGAMTDTNDGPEVAGRMDKIRTTLAGTASSPGGCAWAAAGAAAGCAAVIPWACVGGAIVTACECLPLIVEEFGGTECPFF